MLKLFIFLWIPISTALLDYGLIKNYFEMKKLQQGTVYTCDRKNEQVKIAKYLMLNNLVISVFNTNDVNFYINNTALMLESRQNMGFVLDGECSNLKEFLEMGSENDAFFRVHHWLIFMDTHDFYDIFKMTYLTISSDVIVVVPLTNITSNITGDAISYWNVYDIYNPAAKNNGELKISTIGYYTHEEGFHLEKLSVNLYWKRRNMTGVSFKTMVTLPKPYPGKLLDYLYSDEHREVNTFNRLQTLLIYYIRDFFKFSLEVGETKSWGYKFKNGSFDGMVGALERKAIDFGASPIFVKDERWPVLDYGRRSWRLKSSYIFRMPKKPVSYEVFLRPLDPPVWWVTFATCVLIIIILKFTVKWENENTVSAIPNEKLFESNVSFLSVFCIGALSQQGTVEMPSKLCSRIIILFIYIFTFLLFQYYAASIVSSLLAAPAKLINSLSDLVESQLKLACEDILYNHDYIDKLANDPVISKMEKKAVRGKNLSFYMDPEIGLSLVAKGGYAFHVEVTTAYPIISETYDEDMICSLDEVQMFQTQPNHQVLQKRSHFTEMLDYKFQQMDEVGLMNRQLKFWNSAKPECISSGPKTSAVSLEEFYPALMLLLLGMVASIILLMLEILVKMRKDHLERKEFSKGVKPFKKVPYDIK